MNKSILAIALAALALPAATSSQWVVDPGFENGSSFWAPWGYAGVFSANHPFYGIVPFSGYNAGGTGGVYGWGHFRGFFQTTLPAGSEVTVTLNYHALDPRYRPANPKITVGSVTHDLQIAEYNQWLSYTCTFTTVADATYVQVESDNPVAWDDVRVNAVPEPATMLALGTGLVALARRRRRA